MRTPRCKKGPGSSSVGSTKALAPGLPQGGAEEGGRQLCIHNTPRPHISTESGRAAQRLLLPRLLLLLAALLT